MNEIVGAGVFKAVLSFATGSVAGIWFVYDGLKIWWLRRADSSDPVVRDKRFGYAIGMVIGAIGLIGVARFNGLL